MLKCYENTQTQKEKQINQGTTADLIKEETRDVFLAPCGKRRRWKYIALQESSKGAVTP